MKKTVLILFLILSVACAFTQSSALEALLNSNLSEAEDVSSRVQLAMSSSDYKVTAGDVYKLAFAAGSTSVTYPILVDSSYMIRVANLAVIDASGNTYLSLKRQIEDIVTKNYPMSGVQFTLVTPATFYVKVNGEVKKSVEKKAWALSRLSSVLGDELTDYSSIRDVTVTSANGEINYYDLFKAARSGDFSQDPYVRPGDTITISKIRRVVTVSGEVERPGEYELMRGENLKALIQYYGNGLTELADTSRITLIRNRQGTDLAGNTIYLTQDSIDEDLVLNNGDKITIGSTEDLIPTIIVEGIIHNQQLNTEVARSTADAVTAAGANKATVSTSLSVPSITGGTSSSAIKTLNMPDDTLSETDSEESIYRISVKFYPGENYASLARRISDIYGSYSDLQNAYVERSGTRIPLNIEEFISDYAKESTVIVEPNDVLFIPFNQRSEKVIVNGEVASVREENALPLRRLSSIIENNLTAYSSIRNVQVTSVDGSVRTYDLFKFDREGDIEQNPYVRAGETVTVQRSERTVTLKGAVERPGTYQLLEGENLAELLSVYGNGLAPLADASRIELTRTLSSDGNGRFQYYLNQDDIQNNFALLSYDTVTVSTYTSLKPVMFLEGAIKVEEGTKLESSTRMPVRFERGTNYAYLVRTFANYFTGTSDTENAYIIRGEKIVPVNLNPMLYDASYYSDLTVEENDILRIPFKQFFVSVAGSVNNPGRYPYIPDRDYSYYIGLAGGFKKTENASGAVEIVDRNGNKLQKDDEITPECTITAKTNSFTYFFNQYAPIISTTLQIVASIFSIIIK